MNAPASLPSARFVPQDPAFAARVRASFGRQRAMALIGASLTLVESGRVEIELPCREDLTQQKGYVHGGIIGMIADSACGYAAYTLMPATSSESLLARGEVIKPGRTLSVTRAEVYARQGGKMVQVAAMQQTLMTLPDTPDAPE